MSTIGDSSGAGNGGTNDQPKQDDSIAEEAADIVDSEDESETECLSRDLVFDVLKNQRRRYALHYLKRQEESVQLSELAEQVAAWENDTTVGAISAAERKRVYTALYQSHLPKLDDAAIVDYNQNRGIVELSEAADQLDVYLEMDSRSDVEWSKWYLTIAAGGVTALTGAWLELPPFSMMAEMLLAVLIVLGFTLVAVVHTYYVRGSSAATTETPPELSKS